MADDLEVLELRARVAALELENARLRESGGVGRVVGSTPEVHYSSRPVSSEPSSDCADDPDAMPSYWTCGAHSHPDDGGALRDFGGGCAACDTYWRRAAVWVPPGPSAAERAEDAQVRAGVILEGAEPIAPDEAPDPEIDLGRRPGFRSFDD